MPCVKSSSSFSLLCLHCDRCPLDIIYVLKWRIGKAVAL
jgi:hypothetical protein